MMLLNGVVVLLATFLLTASPTQVSAQQVECFTAPSPTIEMGCESSDPSFNATSIEACCVQSDGEFYRQTSGDQTCQVCIVFGWFNGTEVTIEEGGDVVILQLGFIKGASFEEFVAMDSRGLRFMIEVTAGTATEGPNDDFTVPTGSRAVTIEDATVPAGIQTLIRVDRLALEVLEDFTMTLMSANAAAVAALAAAGPNQFSIPTIRVVIEDTEMTILQFTETDYSNVEGMGFIRPAVQLGTDIATDLTFEAVPVTYTSLNDSNSSIITDNVVPDVAAYDPSRPINATSVEDFDNTSISIMFPAGQSAATIALFDIDIVNDGINEVEQVFVIFLQVVSAVDPDRVDLSGRFATLGRIIDDDPLIIGFEQSSYTIFEQFAFGDLTEIPIIKGNDQQSELTFSVTFNIITGSDPSAANIDQTDLVFRDIVGDLIQNNNFEPDQQSLPFRFELVDDDEPETLEVFQVELSLEESGLNVDLGGTRDGVTLFASTMIFIIDDDATVTMGWEEVFTAVSESQGVLELCVVILNITGDVFPPDEAITLAAITIRGSAADPGDYVPLTEEDLFLLDITATNSRTCIDVTIEDDDLLEETENFTVAVIPDPFSHPMGLPPNFFLVPNLTVVEIRDNDFVRIGFTEFDYAVVESDPFATVTVAVLENRVQRPVRVNFSTAVLPTDTATAGVDYTTVVMELLFDENIDEINVMIPITDDSIVEGDEIFTASLVRDPMDPPDEVIISPDTAIVRIRDDDRVTIGFEEPEYNVTEGVDPTVQICAVLTSGSLERGVTVTFSTSDGSAMAPGDYTATTVMFFFDGNSIRSCVNVAIVADSVPEDPENFCGNLDTFDGSVDLDPDKTVVTIIDAGVPTILVNDTVIGDPLFTVPVYVPDIENSGIGLDSISLCYEIHGQSEEWFNLVTDECTSVNAHYVGAPSELNVINQIAIRAVDNVGICREILVQRDGCTVEIDGVPFNGSRYDIDGIMIRRYSSRVRVAVPNCQEQNLVMWITCETTTQYTPDDVSISVDSIRFDVMRGLNLGHRDSHGIIGQFWNVPVQLAPFSGTLRNGAVYENAYTITVPRTGSPTRVFTGQLDDRIWDRSLRPCLYTGNQQAGAIYEVVEPNDPVIEGTYASYLVPSAFDETDYQFSRFEESMCS